MRKLLSVLLSFTLLVLIMPTASVFANTTTTVTATLTLFEGQPAEQVTFLITQEETETQIAQVSLGDGVSPLNLVNAKGKLVIPEKIVGDNGFTYYVTGISSFAFQGKTEITEVVFPKDIKLIEESAFKGCINLNKISFVNPATTFENEVFSGCTNLIDVTLPSNLTTISSNLFRGTGLVSITIPKSVTLINDLAFAESVNLQAVYFEAESQLQKISGQAFLSCPLLHTIDLSNTALTTISTLAFAGTTPLKSLVLPATFTTFENYASAGVAHFTNPINLYFEGNYNAAMLDGLNALPEGSNIYFKEGTTGWEAVLSASSYQNIIHIYTSTGVYNQPVSANTILDITTAADINGIPFIKWATSNGGTFENELAATTKFTTPNNNVVINAVYKTVSSLSFNSAALSIPYDTAPVEISDFNYQKVGDGAETITYYDSTGTALATAPTNVGNYIIGISLAETATSTAVLEVRKEFSISKGTGHITFKDDKIIFPFDASRVSAKDFASTYTMLTDGALYAQWYNDAGELIQGPTNAGDYQIGIYSLEGENYHAIPEVRKDFTISAITTNGSVSIDLTDVDGNGKYSVNDTLTANTSLLTPAGINFLYQWQFNGQNIVGANASTYTIPENYTWGEFKVIVISPQNFIGNFESPSVGEKEPPAAPVYNILDGAMQTVSQNSTLSFKTDIQVSNFAGIWVDGISRDVNLISTVSTEGLANITLKSSFLQELSLGEHLISFIAKDGGITSTFFTITTAVPVATPVPTPAPTIEPEEVPVVTPAPTIMPTITPEETVAEVEEESASIPVLPILLLGAVATAGVVFIIKKREEK